MNNKTSELDHIPTQVLKKILPIILGAITEIFNISLSIGSFAQDWKTAIVKPLLKKLGTDLIKKNYRPVSNLSFLSKLVEWCILKQLLQLRTQKKTEYIMFGSCQQLTKINSEPLQAGHKLIELSNKVKYLATLLDNTLSFDQHI